MKYDSNRSDSPACFYFQTCGSLMAGIENAISYATVRTIEQALSSIYFMRKTATRTLLNSECKWLNVAGTTMLQKENGSGFFRYVTSFWRLTFGHHQDK